MGGAGAGPAARRSIGSLSRTGTSVVTGVATGTNIGRGKIDGRGVIVLEFGCRIV